MREERVPTKVTRGRFDLACPLVLISLTTSGFAEAQVIDFETLPGGTPTTDVQAISNEYSGPPFGVSFAIVDSNEQPIGFPRIAKVGTDPTAFFGCPGGDEPLPGQAVGSSFLTDDGMVGFSGDLLITYSSPVAQASGWIVDVDLHPQPPPTTEEEWTITARNSMGSTVASDVITAPVGPDNPCSQTVGVGPGDGLALQWTLQSAGGDIASILIEYTGSAPAADVGLAFDNFSPATIPHPVPALGKTSIAMLAALMLLLGVGWLRGRSGPEAQRAKELDLAAHL